MKKMLLAAALIGLAAATAHAQPDNLAGGVFIAHYPPDLTFCDDPTDYCIFYEPYAISTCEEQNPRIDTAAPTIWWVLAAFNTGKDWCGTEFGLGAYDPSAYIVVGHGQCPMDALVIPSGGFPGPGGGIAIATTATPWTGNFRPVYWFAGYGYYPTVVRLTVNPATGFGGFANCMIPPTAYPAACFGAMGIMQDGVECCPFDLPTHACCVGETCVLVYLTEECLAQGGIDHPEWTTCEGNPCYTPPPPVGVCCFGWDCAITTEADCDAVGGHWLPEYDDCYAIPDICGPSPVDRTTWGAIKAIYR